MGHRGYGVHDGVLMGSHGQWHTWAMGYRGYGAYGQWGTGVMGHMGNGVQG